MTKKILKATHAGMLKIGDTEISCAVLEDGTRLLTRATFIKAMGRTGKAKGGREYDDEFKTPVFLSANNLKPFIPKELLENSRPIIFKLNGKNSIGYKAELLPQVCTVFMDADENGSLLPNQQHIAQKCKLLVRGFVTVGIMALVDEATGYQDDRAKDALAKILEQYLAEELQKWTKTFPDEFYREMFRLKKWQWKPWTVKRPSVIGRYTIDLVYDRIAVGVRVELEELNPKQAKGYRKARL
ncbi:MAG TPA: hypothetical protein ENH82_14675 [bacterium]|nr:hypothetical protein [bacterium]